MITFTIIIDEHAKKSLEIIARGDCTKLESETADYLMQFIRLAVELAQKSGHPFIGKKVADFNLTKDL